MVGIPVLVGDIVFKGVGLVSAGSEIAENLLSSKHPKDILKDVNKFDFKGNFD
jgi:hypothetical protein